MANNLDRRPEYNCINIDPDLTSQSSNIPELLGWVNDRLDKDYRRLQELSNGAAYALFMNLLFPGTVPLDRIKFASNHELDSTQNFKSVQDAFKKVGCNRVIPVAELVEARFTESLQFLQWFKKFHDANCEQATRDRLLIKQAADFKSIAESSDKRLVIFPCVHDVTRRDDDSEREYTFDTSLIDHAWSRRILELVVNKTKLMESFSWLSTVGGGFSALGERDKRFSARAGALSLGQQLRLAELLGDERLKVMCHLFAALAALQMDNKMICLNYIKRVIIPLINEMPYRDPILTNILKHIVFRISAFDRLVAGRQSAIEESRKYLRDAESSNGGNS